MAQFLDIGDRMLNLINSCNVSIHQPACTDITISILFLFRGMSDIESDLHGECADGYQNILCADCEPAYSKTSINFNTN